MLNISGQTAAAKRGSIILLTGCMFSGKTTGLIQRLADQDAAGRPVVLFGPALDTRFGTADAVAHNGLRMACTRVTDAAGLLEQRGEEAVIGIDEAQFFDAGLPHVIARLADEGRLVIVAGLDLDFRGRPFGPMPELAALATELVHLRAICSVCGGAATRTWRKTTEQVPVLLGASERYEARCLSCFGEG